MTMSPPTVVAFLHDRVERAVAAGVPLERLIVDPGHDLNKNTYHSLELTRRLEEIVAIGLPTLVAVSNKDFIGETLDREQGKRLEGSLAAAVICIMKGARIVRMHDVAAAVAATRMTEAVLGFREPAYTRHNMQCIMTDATIGRGWPPPAAAVLDDEQLAGCYAIDDRSRQSVRLNFVASIDGAATACTASPAAFPDRRTSAFSISCEDCAMSCSSAREPCVPKDTARCGWTRRRYGGAARTAWPISRCSPSSPERCAWIPHPLVFTEAPVRAIVVTVGASSHAKREALSRVADVIVCGEERLDVACHARRAREARAAAGAQRRRPDAVWHACSKPIAWTSCASPSVR